MTVTQYYPVWSEVSRMWEVSNVDTNETVAWYEFENDAFWHAKDLNDIELFEEDMAALRGEEY